MIVKLDGELDTSPIPDPAITSSTTGGTEQPADLPLEVTFQQATEEHAVVELPLRQQKVKFDCDLHQNLRDNVKIIMRECEAQIDSCLEAWFEDGEGPPSKGPSADMNSVVQMPTDTSLSKRREKPAAITTGVLKNGRSYNMLQSPMSSLSRSQTHSVIEKERKHGYSMPSPMSPAITTPASVPSTAAAPTSVGRPRIRSRGGQSIYSRSNSGSGMLITPSEKTAACSIYTAAGPKEHAWDVFTQELAMAEGWVSRRELQSAKTLHTEHLIEATPNLFKTARTFFIRLVAHQVFDYTCTAVILLNTVLLGATVDYAARTVADAPVSDGEVPATLDIKPKLYDILEKIFSGLFILELLLRLMAGGQRFFTSSEASWNIFDTIVVGSDVLEMVIDAALQSESSGLGNFSLLRVLRVLRVTRALRIIRLVRFCRELRMMVVSVMRSASSLLWSMVMLALVIFIFGVYIMHQVTFHLGDARMPDKERKDLTNMFGTLITTIYTLYKAVSGGVSWGEISDPLVDVHWSNGLIMSFFVFFTVFSVMNIITGLFVDTAIRSAQNDREEVIQEQLRAENSTFHQMLKIFKSADSDDSGTITLEEFEDLLTDERIRAHLHAIGLEVNKARGLFRLLDLDMLGSVSIDEFAMGCMRLKGNARSVDIATLMYENKRMFEKLKSWFQFVNSQFKMMNEVLNRSQEDIHLVLTQTAGSKWSRTDSGALTERECSANGSNTKQAEPDMRHSTVIEEVQEVQEYVKVIL